MVVGISGTALGAILKSDGHSYKDLSILGLVIGVIMAILSFLILVVGISGFATWVGILPKMETLTLSTAILGAIGTGVWMFLALLFGGAVYDVAEWIIKESR